jgi:hypothetical protein
MCVFVDAPMEKACQRTLALLCTMSLRFEYFVTLRVSEDWSMCTKIRISSFLKKIRISSTNVGSSYDVKVNTSPRGKYTSEY